jgi:PIN domain nuclease of toxin-antitoxin system
MRYLLDTHTFIWAMEGNPRLSIHAQQVIQSANDQIWVSMATFWEMAIKINLGKMTLQQPLSDVIQEAKRQKMQILPIYEAHVLAIETFPLHHRDPFDRMLIAQAAQENLAVLGCDVAFDAYTAHIQRIW